MASVLLIVTRDTLAFYNSQTGRWLNRDPIEEQGGLNVYRFVANDAVHQTDRLGLFVSADPHDPWNIFQTVCPLCNGKRYSLFRACCCKDGKLSAGGPGSKIVSRKKKATGVVTHKWSGPGGPGGFAVHWWLTWEGGSADANSYALVMQPGDGKVKSPAGATPAPSKAIPLELSPCKYDFKKLHQCLTRLGRELVSSTLWRWCWDLPPEMIDTCMKESEGCTDAP